MCTFHSWIEHLINWVKLFLCVAISFTQMYDLTSGLLGKQMVSLFCSCYSLYWYWNVVFYHVCVFIHVGSGTMYVLQFMIHFVFIDCF